VSYLDLPRLHFAGEFSSDPSTIDNQLANFDQTVTLDLNNAMQVGWEPYGRHWFSLKDCTVRSAVDSTGAVKKTAADDPIVGATVESTNLPQFAKLVDLDPEWQFSSQIWGLELAVTLPSSAGSFKGRMTTGTLRDLWLARAPGHFAASFSGGYQSVLTPVVFNPPTGPTRSPILDAIHEANRLSIKFVLYAYNKKQGTSGFATGKIVGTIGPSAADEPDHFLAARRLEPTGLITGNWSYGGPFGPAPFQVDATRSVVVVDLGNAIPEGTLGATRVGLTAPRAQVSAGISPSVLGTLDFDPAHLESNAGVQEVPLTLSQSAALLISPLTIDATGVILAERPRGEYLDVSERVLRLNPGDTATVEFAATAFGKPKSGQKIGLRLLLGRDPASGVTFPASVTTGANGRASATIKAADPGHPRPDVDGQVYQIGIVWGVAASGTAPDWRGIIVVRVFDKGAAVVSPKWADVQPILNEYARVFPSMKAYVDLADYTSVKPNAARIQTTLSYPETDPRYMPVTRDLSRDKRSLITRWIAKGCPA
jgi:hypothetical protein